MRQSEILLYARRHCADNEHMYKKMYQESGDESWLAEAKRWDERWTELDRMLVDSWNKETGETKEETEAYVNDPFKL